MSRRMLTVVLIVAGVALLGVAVWQSLTAGFTPGTLALAGDAHSEVHTVRAPRITYPVPDYAAGFPKPPGAGAGGGGSKQAKPQASQQPTVSGVIDAIYVQQGDHVKAGQKIVQLDTKMLELGVKQAQAAADKAHADVAVIGKSLGTVQTNQDKLATARGTLATAQQQLALAEQQLTTAQAQALAGRAQVVAGIAAVEAVINGPHPPGPWPPPDLTAKLAQLKATLAGIDAGLAAMPAAQAALAAGKAQIASGKTQLATGATALRDARKQLEKAQDVLTEVAKGQDVLIDIAKYRVRQATLYAPVDGTVTEARHAGTVAMVNAPLVRIRPDGASSVDTFLTGDQLRTVSIGSSATVNYDSNSAGWLPGRVTLIASSAQFPPSSFPTNVVHMTQTVRVRITLEDGGWAPPGTPVDVRIKTDSAR